MKLGHVTDPFMPQLRVASGFSRNSTSTQRTRAMEGDIGQKFNWIVIAFNWIVMLFDRNPLDLIVLAFNWIVTRLI